MFEQKRRKYVAELTDYFGRLGLAYTGDGVSQQSVTGPYQGYPLLAECSRKYAGGKPTYSGYDSGMQQETPLYRDYLRVGFRTQPVPPVVVFHRSEYATRGHMGSIVTETSKGRYDSGSLGFSVLADDYLNFAAHLDTSAVPEFAAEFIISSDDHDFARKLLPPEVLSWIARDPRSAPLRLAFGESAIVTFRSERTEDRISPDSLFQPKWIFPAADFLVELFQRLPAGVLHSMTAAGGA